LLTPTNERRRWPARRPHPRGRDTNVAYVATTEQRGNGATLAILHTVDLVTGATGTLGKIGGPKTIRGIAVAP